MNENLAGYLHKVLSAETDSRFLELTFLGKMRLINSIFGCFLGIASGDAIGMPLEFLPTETVKTRWGRVNKFVSPQGHDWHKNKTAGQWTDDWFFSSIIAESLIAKGSVDMEDMARRHAESLSMLKKFGGGEATRFAIRNLAAGCHWEKSGKPEAEGNGVVMKISPVGLMLAEDWLLACIPRGRAIPVNISQNHCEQIIDLALMTHSSPAAAATALMQVAAITACCLDVENIEDIFKQSVMAACEQGYETLGIIDYKKNVNLHSKFSLIFKEEVYKQMSIEEYAAFLGKDTGRVDFTLPFCYGAFLKNPRSIETLYDVINAGGDTDSNGSIVGSLLGAYNGVQIFKSHLTENLSELDSILSLAGQFCATFIE